MKTCVLLTVALGSAATTGALAQSPLARRDTTFFDASWHHVGRPNAVFSAGRRRSVRAAAVSKPIT